MGSIYLVVPRLMCIENVLSMLFQQNFDLHFQLFHQVPNPMSFSRLEHGEEVYASVFISIIKYYSTHIDIGCIFNPDFEISPDLLLSSQDKSFKKILSRKIDAIKEELNEAHTTGISHLEFIKKLIMDF